MEIRSRIFEKYTDYKFSIPLKGNEKVFVKQGSYVKIGDKLFEGYNSGIKKSIYLPKIINCKVEDSFKYISRINGEYVDEGDILAQKVSSGGLTVTEAVASVSGILDLSRISKGYMDILGEETSTIFESDFDGYINTINPNDGMVVTADATCIDAVATTKTESKYFGKLEILADGNSIVTEKILDTDYSGKIVWVGPVLYDRVAFELFERGAVAILTYAISYSEFRNIGLPVAVLGGFGSVHCDPKFIDRLITLKGRLTILDGIENQLFIISGDIKENRGWFVDQYINQTVISRAQSSYGYIGKIVDMQGDSGYVFVDFDKKGKSLLHIGSLDFIDL
ncbi:hypothetical protein CVU76_03295 [Candidatus Dojkabacteria bacterium HGW-Dojkabacteria-1]|uniref:Uncharacterized protein n=1 Tax=Candidatus Dojkabacteria bacterium HGW-Dojkabacteria-1 TaxID=2013761 RepID=A0A2N2F485_9BACT|nr:MAG: hypothetical protein CVU76_03295 [Candidatus Dojkabacteria bacterium HGW-Dojkabacteria-1]